MSVTMQDPVRSQRPSPLGTRVDDAVLAKRVQRSRLRLIASTEVNALAPAIPGPPPAVAFTPSPPAARPLPNPPVIPRELGTGGLNSAPEPAPAAVPPAETARPVRAVAPRQRHTLPSAPALLPPPRPAARAQLAYRLTLRGQRVLVVAGFLLAVLLGGAVGAVLGAEEPALVPTDTITVQPGDSLWSIAGTIAPGSDLRPVMDQIRVLNGIEGSAISTGQKLLVPVP